MTIVPSQALKTCPFCGGKAVRKDDPGVIGEMYGLVVDHQPGCFFSLRAIETDAQIDAAWNQRVSPPAPDTTEVTPWDIEQAERHYPPWGWKHEAVMDLAQFVAEVRIAARQAFLTEILDHLTTEHSGGLGSHPGARVIEEALRRKFGTPLTSEKTA